MIRGLLTTENGFVLARAARAAGRESTLQAAVEAGELVRVRRGVYAAPLTEDRAYTTKSVSEQWAIAYRRQVLAAAQTMRAPIFTSYSAIALHDLPIVRRWPDDVIVLAPDRQGHRRRGVISVGRPTGIELQTELIDGCAVTSIEQSLIQLCRHASLGAALTAVDAALRATPASDQAPRTTIERLRETHGQLGRYTASRKVAAVLERATSESDSPLETCSRLVIEEWGFPPPALQHGIWLPELGKTAYLDFFWEKYGIGAEADGNGKYLGSGDGEATGERVVLEKNRENALRRRLEALDRWDWTDMWAREPIRDRLVRAGLPQVRRPIRLL